MWRHLLRWLTPLLLAGACCVVAHPAARAQQPPAPATPEATERTPPALACAVAVLSTLLVLVLVCYPSRKSYGTGKPED